MINIEIGEEFQFIGDPYSIVEVMEIDREFEQIRYRYKGGAVTGSVPLGDFYDWFEPVNNHFENKQSKCTCGGLITYGSTFPEFHQEKCFYYVDLRHR